MIGSLVSNPKKIVIKGVGFYYIGNKNLGVFRTGGHLQKTQIQSLPKKVRQISFPKRFIKGDIKNDAYFGGTEPKRRKDTPLVHKGIKKQTQEGKMLRNHFKEAKVLIIFLSFLLLLMYCKKQPLVLLDETARVEKDSYRGWSFQTEKDKELTVDFAVTSGGAVDLLLMNEQGYNDFQKIFKFDTISITGVIPPEEMDVKEFIPKLTGRVILIFSSDLPADISVVDEEGSIIEEAEGETEWIVEMSLTINKRYYVVIENPDEEEELTYLLFLAEQKGTTFQYYPEGSALNTKGKTYTFKTPLTQKYYIVVNNAGGISGGATPIGPVDFRLKITAK